MGRAHGHVSVTHHGDLCGHTPVQCAVCVLSTHSREGLSFGVYAGDTWRFGGWVLGLGARHTTFKTKPLDPTPHGSHSPFSFVGT